MTQGYNGEIALHADDVRVGYVAGESYGYKRNLRVTVDVRMEVLDRRKVYETTDHRKVTRPMDFAITTSVWRPDGRDIVAGGATVEPLRELVKLARGFTRDDIAGLLRTSAHHLNDMQAGCDHQDPARGMSQAACPETGYRYGSAWLVKPLPEWLTPDYVRGLLHITEA